MIKIQEYKMVLTIIIFFLVGKIKMTLPKSKEGHECRVIQMTEPEREQFGRFLCLSGSRQNRCLDSFLIDAKTPKAILFYLDSCVK